MSKQKFNKKIYWICRKWRKIKKLLNNQEIFYYYYLFLALYSEDANANYAFGDGLFSFGIHLIFLRVNPSNNFHLLSYICTSRLYFFIIYISWMDYFKNINVGFGGISVNTLERRYIHIRQARQLRLADPLTLCYLFDLYSSHVGSLIRFI